jgi:hypothetical protein
MHATPTPETPTSLPKGPNQDNTSIPRLPLSPKEAPATVDEAGKSSKEAAQGGDYVRSLLLACVTMSLCLASVMATKMCLKI